MGEMLREAMADLAAELKAHNSRTVKYVDGACEATVQATVGRTLLKLTDAGGGVQMVWTDRDYLVAAADLEAAGVTMPPRRGQKVRETVGGAVQVYELLTPGAEPVWRWADPHRTLVRVHTKYVGSEW